MKKVKSKLKRQGNGKVNAFFCQHCKYRTVRENNIILHNRAVHGGPIDQEKGMEAPVPKTGVSEAPIQAITQQDIIMPMPLVTSWKIEIIEDDIAQ